MRGVDPSIYRIIASSVCASRSTNTKFETPGIGDAEGPLIFAADLAVLGAAKFVSFFCSSLCLFFTRQDAEKNKPKFSKNADMCK